MAVGERKLSPFVVDVIRVMFFIFAGKLNLDV